MVHNHFGIQDSPPQANQAADGVRVIPGLPDPDSGMIYQLQAGRWYTEEVASFITQRLQAAGFNTTQKNNQGVHWVYATDIPASIVYFAIQRMGVLGIREVWVWE